MIIWLNGCFGVGKSTAAEILCRRRRGSHLYDPEQAGFFLWDNFPPELRRNGDFQDIPAWRAINYEVLKYLDSAHAGDIIVPMTLADHRYFDQIVGRLERDGIAIRHFILTAPRDVIAGRLRARGESPGSWAERQLDRCLDAFTRDIPGIKVDTASLDAASAADWILTKI